MHQRAQLAADEAFGSLERLLRTAELAGHDPDRVLHTAIESRSLADAESPAQVLHHRITHALSGRLTPRVSGGAADLIPHHLRHDDVPPADAKRAARLHQLADAADTRRHELGAQTAAEAPAWAIDALGPVPGADEVIARQDWEQRAGWAAAYRELVAHTDEHDPLGNAPGKGRVEHAVLFRAAHEALALVDAGAEEANLSDGALRSRVWAYERELTWAPRWVDDELAAAHQAHTRAGHDATVWATRADAPDTDPTDAERLRADAAAAREEAARLAEQVAQLDAIDAARAAWFAHTAVTRDNAERSRVELKARGVDPDRPDDRTTGPEWLALHRAEQADRERDQPVTELDVADTDPADEHRGDDRPAERDEPVETAVPDVREVSTPDPTEAADPTERRRVRPVDETAVAVQRAQESLAEISQRQAADAARAEVDAAEREAAEAARRAELSNWSADATDTDTSGEENVLTREA